ncbi:MAG: Obg family GTPase CgtA, partial [Armatimonadota bacterium]
LKILADVGIVGFPNVAKSTLIARVSAAKPKIASYPFTTLQPNLGVVKLSGNRRMVIADMPGLIEGAHDGTGLGHKFLRHVERTYVLIHMLDAAGVEGRDPLEDFEKINRELALYDERLGSLPQVVALNKVDLPDGGDYAPLYAEELESDGHTVVQTSAVTGEGCTELLEEAWSVLSEQEEFRSPETDREPKEFEIPETLERSTEVLKVAENIYLVRGTAIEKLISRLDADSPESAEWLHEQLSRLGVIERLNRAGATEGDTVFLENLETEYSF